MQRIANPNRTRAVQVVQMWGFGRLLLRGGGQSWSVIHAAPMPDGVVVDLLFYIPSIAAGAIPRTVQIARAIRSVGSARPDI